MGKGRRRAARIGFIPHSSSTTFTTGQPGWIVRVDSAGQDFSVYDLQLPQGAVIDYLTYIPDGQSLNMQLCGVLVRCQFDIATNYLPAMLNIVVPQPLKMGIAQVTELKNCT